MTTRAKPCTCDLPRIYANPFGEVRCECGSAARDDLGGDDVWARARYRAKFNRLGGTSAAAMVVEPLRRTALCVHCGDPFEQVHGGHKFCCAEHRIAADTKPCVCCGELVNLNHHSGLARRRPRCAACGRASESRTKRAQFGAHNRRLARMYLAGQPLDKIAAKLGYTDKSHVANQIGRLRKRGWDLPYRKPGWEKRAA